jgi:uncharacterized protein (TIGR02145 family)
MKLLNFFTTLGVISNFCFAQNKLSITKQCAASSTDSLPFKTVKIGSQIWSAENISVPLAGSVCYEDNPENCKTFGPLYTYAQAKEVANKFPGWRLPTKADVDLLIAFLGGEEKAGKELKQGGVSGFNALMAGYRESQNGKYYRINKQTGFWTSTPGSGQTAWKFYMSVEKENINFHPVDVKYGDSIRLIKED